jgi:hypothetical protein
VFIIIIFFLTWKLKMQNKLKAFCGVDDLYRNWNSNDVNFHDINKTVI